MIDNTTLTSLAELFANQATDIAKTSKSKTKPDYQRQVCLTMASNDYGQTTLTYKVTSQLEPKYPSYGKTARDSRKAKHGY
jgi:hypothetical protein